MDRMTLRIYCLLLITLFPFMAWGQGKEQKEDSVSKELTLKETVVTGSRIIHHGDHELLFLTEANRKYGTNALDAVSSLAMFTMRLNASSLLSYDNRQVFVLINGVPSTAMDLRSYKASDIKHVEYYAVAPAKYLVYTSGPVANIIVKKKHDRLYSAYANLQNSVHLGFGDDQLSLSYADSLNQVKLDYFLGYRDVHHLNMDYHYNLDGISLNSLQGDGKRYKSWSHDMQASYQRYQGSDLLNVRLRLSPAREKSYSPASARLEQGGAVSEGSYNDSLTSHSDSYALDMYYMHILSKNKSWLSFNVVNTFVRSRSDREMRETYQLFPQYDFVGSNHIKNHIYSFIGNAAYGRHMLGGTFNAAAKYSYSRLRQEEGGKTFVSGTFAYASMYWTTKTMTYYPIVGFNVYKQKTPAGSRTDKIPYLYYYTGWWGKGSLEGFNAYTSWMYTIYTPSMGDLTTTRTSLAPGFTATGNASLKPFWKIQGSLVMGYFKPKGEDQIVFSYYYNFYHKPFMSTLTLDGAEAVLQQRNVGSQFRNVFSLSWRWKPAKWLMLSSYMMYAFSNYTTPTQHVKERSYYMNGSVNLLFDPLTISFNANMPIKSYDGDVQKRGSSQYSIVAQYKWKDWSFGVMWNYLGINEYTMGRTTGFEYKERSDWRPLRTLFRLSATWSFSKGKARRHASRNLNNSFNDNGLNEYNKPQMPK